MPKIEIKASDSTEQIAFKAFDPDLKCRGFQYEVGETYRHDGKVELCKSGFHAVLVPFDAWNYYPLSQALARVKLDGVSSPARESDSKVVAASITIEARLSLPEWIRAQASVVVDLCRTAVGALTSGAKENAAATGYSGHAAATGYSGHAAATGDSGHAAATGDSGHAAATGYSGHAAATGDYGHAAATGKQAVAVAIGNNGKAKAGEDGWLVLARYSSAGNLLEVKAGKVGTDGIEAGKWYRLNARGAFVAVGEDD